jgi:predicted nucleic acid-binding protein
MSGTKAILDTNVVIFISKKQIDIDKLLSLYDEFYVSIVTYMEVYGFEFENEEEKVLIDHFFEIIEIISVSMDIAQKVVEYKKSKQRKIKLPDAIILATANYINADLLSDDWDDFIKIDKQVNVLNINELKK